MTHPRLCIVQACTVTQETLRKGRSSCASKVGNISKESAFKRLLCVCVWGGWSLSSLLQESTEGVEAED